MRAAFSVVPALLFFGYSFKLYAPRSEKIPPFVPGELQWGSLIPQVYCIYSDTDLLLNNYNLLIVIIIIGVPIAHWSSNILALKPTISVSHNSCMLPFRQ